MIRPLTFLSLVAAAGAGLHLYSVKHEVSQLEKTLRETVRQTEQARERTAVLRAEWAMLNEPERLRAAATRNLPLEVMQTSQFVRAAELDRRLPAAVAFAGAPSLFAPPPAEHSGDSEGAAPVAIASTPVAGAAAAAVGTAAHAAQGTAATAQAAPVASVSVVPVASRAPVQVAATAARPATPPAERVERAERTTERGERAAPQRAPSPAPQVAGLRPPQPRAASRPPVAPARAAEPEVDRAMNLANRPQPPHLLRTALHVRHPAPAQRAPEMPAASSMLGGMGRPALAPPVPMASSSANAATLR
ncbi:cell division protein FtsL [Roseomonas xinghualingensis]|uniref:cell division protein FtsL n=1 Tax=Roseomonas xinghualingensis TaxID=2986475 RepID=UPI0021F217AD|nr:hypothetical protein [Roseomonas sp. SXEYE001]MCV4207429.1 hypothetical protein [Roseomonas sp. SXEYE001]